MPSTVLAALSGGVFLTSGNIYSGVIFPVGGVQLKLAKGAAGLVYVGLPNLSGEINTITSGGSESSGGLTDGFELSPGDGYFVSKTRMVSGLSSIRIMVPAASSGSRLFWEGF